MIESKQMKEPLTAISDSTTKMMLQSHYKAEESKIQDRTCGESENDYGSYEE